MSITAKQLKEAEVELCLDRESRGCYAYNRRTRGDLIDPPRSQSYIDARRRFAAEHGIV